MKKLIIFLLLLSGTWLEIAAQSRNELTKSAKAGNAEAQYKLGVCYYKGALSYPGNYDEVTPNYDNAEYWFLKAAAHKYMNSYFDLGLLYQYYKIDKQKAIKWYKMYADAWYDKYGENSKSAIEGLAKLGVDYTPTIIKAPDFTAGTKKSTKVSEENKHAPDYTSSNANSIGKMETVGDYFTQEELDIINDAIKRNKGKETFTVTLPARKSATTEPSETIDDVAEKTANIDPIKKNAELYLRLNQTKNAYSSIEKYYRNNKSRISSDDLVTLALVVKNIQNIAQIEGMSAGMTMNFNKVMECTTVSTSANTLYKEMLIYAALQGNKTAELYISQEAALANAYRAMQNNNNYNFGQNSRTGRKTCSLCKGKGWISGSKTPTYGNLGTHWCKECEREVPNSHSHDRCPSCAGKGYIE